MGNHSVINRLYKNMKPEQYAMHGAMNEDEADFFERTWNAHATEYGPLSPSAADNEHYNSSEDDDADEEKENGHGDGDADVDTKNYIKTDDSEIFGNMKDD